MTTLLIGSSGRRSSRSLAPAGLAPPLRARLASATGGLDEQLEIVPPIVVGDLLAGLDRPYRAQDHLALYQRAFCVRPAGVVGVAADVAAGRSIQGPAAVDLEHVAAAGLALARARFAGGDAAAGILDDERALGDRRGGEQAESGSRTADAIALVAHISVRHAAASRVRITVSRVSTGTGSLSVLMPGHPASERRSTSLSMASGASLTTVIAIVTF